MNLPQEDLEMFPVVMLMLIGHLKPFNGLLDGLLRRCAYQHGTLKSKIIRLYKDKKKTAADVLLELDGPDADAKLKVVKSKGSKNVNSGIVHVLATFNNTIVTITDKRGNVIGWSTSGKMGFRGSRKSTAYAAQVVSQDACRQAMGHGLKEADVKVKGPGSGRESAVRAVQGIGIDVKSISDVTPIPHNGCRPKKARRV